MDSIKLAVCVSGLCNTKNAHRNVALMRKQFPTADFFFSTWEGRESDMEQNMPGESYITTPEPKMHYNPVNDVDPSYFYPPNAQHRINNSKDLNKTKQIIGHAALVAKIPPEYNMIIRTRYDAFPSMIVDFDPYVVQSYNENRAIGFGSILILKGDKKATVLDVDKLVMEPREYDPNTPRRGLYNNWSSFLVDMLIMHPRNLLDVDQVNKLHTNKQLLACEIGWYQVLSQPYGDTHICIRGGIQAERLGRVAVGSKPSSLYPVPGLWGDVV